MGAAIIYESKEKRFRLSKDNLAPIKGNKKGFLRRFKQ